VALDAVQRQLQRRRQRRGQVALVVEGQQRVDHRAAR
jgi:hypothetical protein